MAVLEVPQTEPPGSQWPTLGPLVCEWMEQNLVHGPGDLRGMPLRLGPEHRFAIYRAYEVWPQGTAQAGTRRFNRVELSWRKGTAKTELGALVAAAGARTASRTAAP